MAARGRTGPLPATGSHPRSTQGGPEWSSLPGSAISCRRRYEAIGRHRALGRPCELGPWEIVVLSVMTPKAPDERGHRLEAGSSVESMRFGVVLPVCNEQQLLPAALASLGRAIDHASFGCVASIGVVVVLDACSDQSRDIAEEWRRRVMHLAEGHHAEIVETNHRSVGEARRVGCEVLLQRWSGLEPRSIWLATTDADSEVPQDWISAQLRMRREGCQVWIGPVGVRDWCGRTPGTAEAWHRDYQIERSPVHGANFGIDAATYLEAGGFQDLRTGEDRALFEEVVALGAVIRQDPRFPVITSGRREARAPRGFAHVLTSIEATITPAVAGKVEVIASMRHTAPVLPVSVRRT